MNSYTRLKKLTVLFAGTAAFAAPVLAQPVQMAENVVVTANFLPTPEREVASAVTIITADQIEARQLRTLPDVLKDVPGLQVVQTGGAGGTTYVFMRGTNSNHTKVIVDGVDLGNPSTPNGAFDYAHLLTGDIERVEVLRGAQSGLYGSDAIGGVINIITKKGSGPAAFTGSLEGGSFDTLNQRLGVGGSMGAFNYVLNAQHLHTGDLPVTPESYLATAPAGTREIGNYYDNKTLSARLGLDVAPNLDLGLVARYTYTALRSTADDFSVFPAVPSSFRNIEYSQQYVVRGTAHFNLLLDNTIGAGYQSNLRSDVSNPFTSYSHYFGSRLKFDWLGSINIMEGQDFTLGASTEENRERGDSGFKAHDRLTAVFGQLQSDIGGNFFNTASLRYDEHNKFGGKTTFRVAPAYAIPELGLKLKGSVGTGFKAPALDQLFHSYPAFFFFANPGLKPETSLGYDLGFEETIFGDQVSYGATWFHNDIENLISVDPVTFSTLVNIGKAKTEGLEAFLAYQPMENLMFRADYTYTESEDLIAHRELLHRPKNKISATLMWRPTEAVTLTGSLLHTGSAVDGTRASFSRAKAPGYTTVDVSTAFDLTPNINVYGRINNLFDREYEVPLGFLAPGRAFVVGIKGTL